MYREGWGLGFEGTLLILNGTWYILNILVNGVESKKLQKRNDSDEDIDSVTKMTRTMTKQQ